MPTWYDTLRLRLSLILVLWETVSCIASVSSFSFDSAPNLDGMQCLRHAFDSDDVEVRCIYHEAPLYDMLFVVANLF